MIKGKSPYGLRREQGQMTSKLLPTTEWNTYLFALIRSCDLYGSSFSSISTWSEILTYMHVYCMVVVLVHPSLSTLIQKNMKKQWNDAIRR